jgi:hypothetical protein
MVLIFVLGILALLAMLVAAFAVETGTELEMAANHRDGERARLVARAGLERAKYELRRSAVTPGFPQPWMMADLWNYSKNQAAPTLGLSAAPSNIQTTVTPSFGVVMPSQPAGITFASAANPNGLPWPSGYVGSTYYSYDPNSGFHGDYYVLKVTDCNSCIDLSDQNPNLGTMINTLAQTVAGNAATPVPDAASNIGNLLVTNRPAGGYRRIEEVQAILLKQFPNSGGQDFASLAPYLTTQAYVDGRVIYMGPSAPNLTITPRAPINVNQAPYPVLVAALNGITGKTADNTTWSISLGQAKNLAAQIIAFRNTPAAGRYGFSSWSQFSQWLQGTLGQRQLAALVLANCNPNTDLNSLVPDASIYQCIDKTQITTGTTELCFEPGGTFLLDSLGVILDTTGKIIAASAECTATVRVWTQYNETNQTDFELNRVDPPGATGMTGLKDLTTLPECRNAVLATIQPDANTVAVSGLRGSLYDGQLTFNTITSCSIGPQSTYCGNIDGTLNGLRSGATNYTTSAGNVSTPQKPAPGQGGDGQGRLANYANAAPGTHPQVARTLDTSTPPSTTTGAWTAWASGGMIGDVNAGTQTAPNLFGGSDLHPLAATVGRGAGATGNRKLMFLQTQTLVTAPHDYNTVTLQMGISLKSSLLTSNSTQATQTNQTEVGATATVSWSGDITHDQTLNGVSTETTNASLASTGGLTIVTNQDSAAQDQTNSSVTNSSSSATDTTAVSGTLTAVVPAWTLNSLDRQTFQFWLKPGQRIPGTTTYWDGQNWVGPTGQTLVLLDWHSGKPVGYGDTVNVSLSDSVSTGVSSSGTIEQAQANSTTGGVNNVGATTIDGNQSGATAALSPELAAIADNSESSSVTWGAETHLVIYATVVAGGLQLCAEFSMPKKTDPPTVQVPSNMSGAYTRDWIGPTVAPGTWHQVMFPIRVANGLPDSGQISGGNRNTAFIVDGSVVGSTGAEPAWPTESDPDARLIQAAYQKMLGDYNNMYQAFQQMDAQDTAAAQAAAAAATWSHNVSASGSMQSVSSWTGAISCDSNLTVSVNWQVTGYTLNGTDSNSDTVTSSSFNKTITPPPAYNAANYPSPVRIPPGQSPAAALINECLPGWTPGADGVCIWVGGVSPNDTVAASDNHVAGSFDFYGLIDNLVIDGDLANSASQGTRYNTFQPSTGGAAGGTVYFQKHVPALEWDKPVMVLAQRATTWTSNGGVDTVDLGTAEMQFGWVPVGTMGPGTFATAPAALVPAGGGWTNLDNNGGQSSNWNTVLNATVLPTKNNQFTGSGFMTTSHGAEEYFYAIQFTPPAAGGPGGPPMTPILDDVKILYMPWDCATVLQEENVD